MIQGFFFALIGFLSGSVLYSYHLPLWLKKINVVKQSADHNPGTVNAIRLAGLPIGLLCLLMDMFKGFWPVLLALRVMGVEQPFFPLVMLAPAMGHAIAPWYDFGGGKAIATAFGILIALMPFSWAAVALALWYILLAAVIGVTPHERCSVVTFFCFAVTCLIGALWTGHLLTAIGCLLVSAVPIYKNAQDIQRASAEEARGPQTAKRG